LRSLSSPKASYTSIHSDDITTLSFHPTVPRLLLSGSTDGLVNVSDTTVTDEDDLVLATLNHDASIHHAAFVGPAHVAALSHDERFAVYDAALGEDGARSGGGEEVEKDFGDLRELVGCQYVADVQPKVDGSGAVLGAGAQE
jgi:WD repeat-containing protein 89